MHGLKRSDFIHHTLPSLPCRPEGRVEIIWDHSIRGGCMGDLTLRYLSAERL